VPDKASSTTNQKAKRPSGPQALYDVLYRSAKQDPERRFHALYDKVARSDMLAQAWSDVAANGGAPGVDGVAIDDIKDGGAEAVGAFLDELAEQLRMKAHNRFRWAQNTDAGRLREKSG
jgi:hypothetical protein